MRRNVKPNVVTGSMPQQKSESTLVELLLAGIMLFMCQPGSRHALE